MFRDMHPTPNISHITREDYNDVYEPSEDSFLLMDVLENDVQAITKIRPMICLEVGSGTGVVSCFLATLLQQPCMFWMTDINTKASQVSMNTMRQNKVYMTDAITSDLTTGLMDRLQGKVDLLLCNPPYVPTPLQEVGSNGIAASWAGGNNGREGLFYLLCVKENKPDEIMATLQTDNISGCVAMQRRAHNEFLMVLRFNHS
ncbi:methyltransferase N6AMT1-like isoform X2 [Dysidea avara]|uniref:methyltransferase N6AMT1-like isoform X2 n=1 Tax=Dysidea avara TaxID=196820 RepID=UPI0033171955